ncbi:YSC84-related protein [Agarivorans sp. TSD2052]|uniref:lipid-binding SYLF domain-containing protein n=1 Tax=Agarivorans sp. TSD2052 TaxID=2937286 RepID=UPI00200FAAD3|nr:YSC84-related protein [Agarivorans sp. TSD2052]UPW17271.1 YSC84-related protein [Agarivorans sp. TSD2052]
MTKSLTAIFAIALLNITISFPALAKSAAEERAESNQMVQQSLADFKKENAELAGKISGSVGYAVFSNAGINLFVISAGGGHGVAIDNVSGKRTYMKMGEAGVGFGAGVKDFRALMVFKTRESYDKFVESGWLFGAQADASAKAGDKGGSAESEGAIGDVEIYQMTEAGLSLEATIKGTKFWKDKDLNQG